MAKQPGIITSAELGQHLKRVRQQRGFSLRYVADDTGISASTLSRCENGQGEMDARSIAVLAGWLDLPVQRIEGEKFIYFQREPLPQIVNALVRTDSKLTDRSREALSAIFQTAYKGLTKP